LQFSGNRWVLKKGVELEQKEQHPGIFFRQQKNAYQVYWFEHGKVMSKSFPISKYGDQAETLKAAAVWQSNHLQLAVKRWVLKAGVELEQKQQSDHPGIFFHKPNNGYKVQWFEHDKVMSKYFGSSMYGDQAETLEAAREWQNINLQFDGKRWILKEGVELEQKQHPGIFFDKQNNRYLVRWCEHDKGMSRDFGVSKYADQAETLEAAKEWQRKYLQFNGKIWEPRKAELV